MNSSSLRNSIDHHCKDCLYDPRESGTWRKQVQNCTMPECHLYPVRPIPGGHAGKRQPLRKRIDQECKTCIVDPHAVGTWRQQVECCGSGHCALYSVRPLPLPKRKPRQESIVMSNGLNPLNNHRIPVPATLVPKRLKSSFKVYFTVKTRGKLPIFKSTFDPSLFSDITGMEVKDDR